VIILLPPSEAKVDGGDGRRFAATGPLGDVRATVLSEVAALCRRDPELAGRSLKLPPGELAEATRRNSLLLTSPTMPALSRYAGVVYQGLAAATLSPAARRVADESVLVFSGGLGVVAATELIPWYRVPASAQLPGSGTVASMWRPVLAAHLPLLIGSNLLIDLRSSDYAALWKPPAGSVVVRILQRRSTGGELVVSFHSKLLKGRLARAIVQAVARQTKVETPAAVAKIARGLGLEVRPTATGLDLVDPDPTPLMARS
jgi:cytoplasmic iron level regulating protein YaaA (DUF328/UPF0246 family)